MNGAPLTRAALFVQSNPASGPMHAGFFHVQIQPFALLPPYQAKPDDADYYKKNLA